MAVFFQNMAERYNEFDILSPEFSNIPVTGYVGVGLVTGECQAATDFMISVDGKETLAMDVLQNVYLQ